jgi:hypothetical protein
MRLAIGDAAAETHALCGVLEQQLLLMGAL